MLLLAMFGCVNVDPVPVSGKGNISCEWNNYHACDGTLKVEGSCLGRDGESIINGQWVLCNDDKGVTCTVDVRTSSSGG